MDFKYVPYPVQGEKLHQLSCVDHHSSWRMIRIFGEKSSMSVMTFLKELIQICPFPIFEIQTDNDTAFTDKFSSTVGVTGLHLMDQWCEKNNIRHKLIPVGVKELNGKVENTHKQDDREFFSKGPYKSFENIRINSRGYNERWNEIRRTKALGWKSPNEVIYEAYVKALGVMLWMKTRSQKPVVTLESARPEKIRTTKKRSSVERYLQFVDWDAKNKNRAIALLPSMSQSFSYSITDSPIPYSKRWPPIGCHLLESRYYIMKIMKHS